MAGISQASPSSDYTYCSSESHKRQLQFYKFSYSSICTVNLLLGLSFPQHLQYLYWINDTNSTPKIILVCTHSILLYTEECHNYLVKIIPLHSDQYFFFLTLALNLQCFSRKLTIWEILSETFMRHIRKYQKYNMNWVFRDSCHSHVNKIIPIFKAGLLFCTRLNSGPEVDRVVYS